MAAKFLADYGSNTPGSKIPGIIWQRNTWQSMAAKYLAYYGSKIPGIIWQRNTRQSMAAKYLA